MSCDRYLNTTCLCKTRLLTSRFYFDLPVIMSQPDVEVYFVEDKSGRQAQLMVNAFTWMSESKLVPKWIKVDDVLAMEHVNSGLLLYF